jgi:hypothetical protein
LISSRNHDFLAGLGRSDETGELRLGGVHADDAL